MNVPNVLGGLADLTSQVGNSAASVVKMASAGKAAAVALTAPPTPTAAMREILSQYDMTDITPSDFSKLIQQLSAKGTISKQDAQELSSIRVDLENADIGSNESVNLLDFYQQKIAKFQAAAANSPDPVAAKASLDVLVGKLNWLQKFATVSPQGGAGGVNAEA
jgi:hypothetical protein